MADIKVLHDRAGQTLTIWFANPTREVIAEEIGEGVVLMKDGSGHVIGLEKLHFVAPVQEPLRIRFETVSL